MLTDPRPPRRAEIAAVARRRFGRSTTIRLFDDRTVAAAVGPAALDLPAAWHRPLAELAGRTPTDAVSHYWHGCDNRRLAEPDGDLVAQVRRALCVTTDNRSQEVRACR